MTAIKIYPVGSSSNDFNTTVKLQGGSASLTTLATMQNRRNEGPTMRSSFLSVHRSAVAGDQIRSRLLNKLGIVKRTQQESRSRPIEVRKVVPLLEPLKYNHTDEDGEEFSNCDLGSSFSSNGSTKSRRSVVAFDDEVSVVPIPKHQEYSDRIRSRLWCDKQELRTMVAMNTLEYQAEGWHWSTVVEDEGFVHLSNGKRIHPVHFQHLLWSSCFIRPSGFYFG